MEITRVGIIGAGTMGSGIAQVCATAGIDAVMIDVSEEAAARGLQAVRRSLERLVSKERLSAADRDAALARIHAHTGYAQLGGCQAIIETATERRDLKLSILRQVEAHVAEDVLITSNTSSISITELAATLSKPERFVGMHFFNPVPVMVLVEVISGLQSSEQAVQRTLALAARLGKRTIRVKNSAGFVVNRVLCPMINEALFALQEGLASAEDIDEGMKRGCNHPIGPLALADMVGLDTLLSVMEVLHAGFGDPKYRPAPLLRELVSAGRLGRKSGWGVYRYGDA